MSTTTDTGKVGKWIDDLKPLLRPITGLEADPHNPRRHDERQIAAIMKMLERWGQHRPATVRGDIVVIGNAMVEAARRLNWTHVAVIRDIVDGRQDSDAESLGRKIADNRAPEIGGSWDKRVLAEEFVAADTGEFQIDDVGFTFEEREAIVTYEREVVPPSEFKNVEAGMSTEFRCPKCKYEWSGQAKPE